MTKRRKSDQPKILGLFVIGAGLILMGIVMALTLPRAGKATASQAFAIPAQVNYPAPKLELSDLQGDLVSLESFRGTVVLVNNWATWCPPCKAEMPTLEAYYQDHQDEDFTIIAVEAGEPVAAVADFADKMRLTFLVWPDPEQQALVAFRQEALPSSYVIDKTGQVRLAWTGAINREMLEKFVSPLLEE